MSVPYTALMVIISVTSAQTPPSIEDDIHVMVNPYETLERCMSDLHAYPLSSTEIETEIKYSMKTMRSCTKINDTSFYYNWKSGRLIGNGFVEAGPVKNR